MTSAFPRVLSLLCVIGLAGPALAESQTASIRDDAEMFHPDAVARAQPRIAEIQRTFHHRLYVQTVASASQRSLFRFLPTPHVNRLLKEQAERYAAAIGGDGIFVVICKKPRDVHVIVRPENDPDFSHHDAELLRRMLAERLDKPDAALDAMVDQVHAALQTHAERGASLSIIHDCVLFGLLGGGVILWLLLWMIRYRMRRHRAVISGEAGEPSRTEDAALLGTMFGFPAGLWIYDKLYPRPAAACPPLAEAESPPPHPAEEEAAPPLEEQHQPIEEPAEDASVSS